MESYWNAYVAQLRLPYRFQNTDLLRRAFIAGDTTVVLKFLFDLFGQSVYYSIPTYINNLIFVVLLLFVCELE